ncbi:UNVERIFIED_CONTAM: GDSL esterase/lipase [Sesamum angustifolium]|uniref:GDSL esterase/lipase n=1 Tax=Sesamum angustifolium TaxID=2727405 RepID=A0AAW2PGC3_9LAMI
MALPSISVVLTLLLLLQILKTDAKVSSIIVFGDSTVDSGNNNYIPTVLKCNFKPYGRDFDGGRATGRFSNGRVPTDFISEAFGLKTAVPAYLDPAYTIKDFATGVCFASAGTGYDNFTSKVLSVIPLWKELEYYKEYQSRLRDYLGNEGKRAGSEENIVDRAASDGCLPLERTTNLASGGGCIDEYNKVAMDFNQQLQALVETLNKELSGLRLVFVNPYATLYDIIQNPHSFGFEHSAIACCGTGRFEMSYLCGEDSGLSCSDANQYVFWDSFHPTEKTNGILANYAVKTYLDVFLQ